MPERSKGGVQTKGDTRGRAIAQAVTRWLPTAAATDWPIVPAPGDYDYGEFGGMKIGRGNRSTQRKPAQAPHCPPQIPLDQTRDRTRAPRGGKLGKTNYK
jgi:hypothetical protein